MKLKRAASHKSAVILVVTAAGWSEAFQTATRSPVRLVPRHHRWSFLVAPPVPSSTRVHSTTEEEAVDTTSKSKDSSSLAFESGANNNKIGAQPIPYSDLTIGVLKETFPGENRVSQTPDTVALLVKVGFHVIVQSGGMFCFSK